MVTNFTVSYKINKKNVAHLFALKLLNANGHKEYNEYVFNKKLMEPEMFTSSVVMPNVSYKIEF